MSVVGQTYTPAEIIVVDDYSTDATPDALDDLRKEIQTDLTVFRHPHNRGVSAARNTGIRNSSGEWIAFLDSDDEWLPEKLEAQHEFHSDNPDFKISQCDEIWIRNGSRVNKRDIHQKQGGYIFKESLQLCLVSPSAVIAHRSLFHEIGFFDESLPACEDYDLWLRVLTKYPIGYLAEPLLKRYGGHDDQLSSRYWGMDRWRVQAMEKHLESELPHDWKVALYEELINKLKVLYQGATKRDKPEAGIYKEKLNTYQDALKRLR